MSDLISRQAAIDVLQGYFDGMLETDTFCPTDLYNLFEIIPSAQQEIIRCKDCGHADWCGLPEGMLYCMVHEHYLSEDDYCSYGVKEDG